MNYYEHRLREIKETLFALRCKPETFKKEIQLLEQERNDILNRLNYTK